MSKDYSTVDARDIQGKGKDLILAISKRCDKKVNKAPIWSVHTVPYKVELTPEQFKELAFQTKGEEDATPSGKELFKSKAGYVFEIKVDQ